MPRILAFSDWYLPGRKAGGVVSALSNLIELLGDDFDFYVFTRDRDLTDNEPYPNVQVDRWVSVGKAKVLYTSNLSLRNVRRRILEIEPDLIHLNSFFAPLTIRALLLRRLGCVPRVPIVIAPRGEFSPGALKIKRLRKWLYLRVAVPLGLYKDMVWQASSNPEKELISAARVSGGIRDGGILRVSSDVPSPKLFNQSLSRQILEKQPGAVRLVFLSRISPNKNLHYALKTLAAVRGQAELQVVGPVDDAVYWAECQKLIRALPDNIVVNHRGPVSYEDVGQALLQSHFLLLPTAGENFGYAILEALAAGRPALISDQTPWRGLSAQSAGWDLPLANRELWQEVIQKCVDMDQEQYGVLARGARRFAEAWLKSTPYREHALDLFREALKCGPDGETTWKKRGELKDESAAAS